MTEPADATHVIVEPPTPTTPPLAQASLWRLADFLKLWTAETVSQFGSQITAIALPLVAILVLEASPFQIGLLYAFDTLPFREGLAYVAGHRLLRHIAACTAVGNLFGNLAFAVVMVYLVRDLGLTPGTIGLILGVGSVGFLIGALLPDRIQRRIRLGPTIVFSALFDGLSVLLVPLAPAANPIPFLIAAQMGIGIGQVVYNVSQVSLRQAITPDSMLGRMNATMRFIVFGTIPVGAVIGGALGSTIGLRETLFVGAAGSTLAFLFVLVSPVRSLRTIPEPAMP